MGNPHSLDVPSDVMQTPPTFKRARLTMGACGYISKTGQACDCPAGECSVLFDPTGQRPDARREACQHLMTDHGDSISSTAPPAAIPALTTPPPKPAEHQNFNPDIIHREHLVEQLIRRAEHTKLVLVRGTPASGKTTLLRLVINQLLSQGIDAHTIHRLALWNEAEVQGYGGWSRYLLAATGVSGGNWLQYDGWLLLDEAQTSYWDVAGLWTDMLKSMDSLSRCRIILFTSHSSAGAFDVTGVRTNCRYYAIPMIFGPLQLVDLRPAQLPSFVPDEMAPIGLLLSEAECRDIIVRTFSVRHHPTPQDDFIRVFTAVSGGHAGALVSLLGAFLRYTPVNPRCASLASVFLQDTEALFAKIGSTPMARGLPTELDLAQPGLAALFRDMLKGIRDESKLTETHRVALNTVRIAGFIYGVTDQQGINVTYEFASPVHEWFVGHCLVKTSPEIMPLNLLLEAVRCFRPDHLSAPPRGAPSVENE